MLKPKWEYIASKYSDSAHTVVYRDDVLKVQMQVVTRRGNAYNPEKAKYFFFMDEDRRTFRSEDDLLSALTKKYDDLDRGRYSLILHWVRSTED